MQRESDENLMLIAAVEQYAHKYGITTSESFELFKKYGINKIIRHNYNALHTQPLDESFYFADDVLKRKLNAN